MLRQGPPKLKVFEKKIFYNTPEKLNRMKFSVSHCTALAKVLLTSYNGNWKKATSRISLSLWVVKLRRPSRQCRCNVDGRDSTVPVVRPTSVQEQSTDYKNRHGRQPSTKGIDDYLLASRFKYSR